MSALPICCVTGRIAGDSYACGDCDPCGAYDKVPDVVKRLMAERDEWMEKYSNAMSEMDEREYHKRLAEEEYQREMQRTHG